MFGNQLGWGISAAIAIVAGYIAYLVYAASTPTQPTGWVQRTVKPLALPATAAAVVPMDRDADAGDAVRRAIADEQHHDADYQKLIAAEDFDASFDRPGIAALLQSTPDRRMTLLSADPASIDANVGYDPDRPPLQAIDVLGKATLRAALLLGTTDPAKAAKYYAAVFALGKHLYDERLVYAELSAGEALMGTGAGGLQRLAERGKGGAAAELAGRIKQFDADRLSAFEANVAPVWKVVSSIDDGTIAWSAGDIFALAADPSVDLLWRTESTLKIGRLRFNAARRGDQVRAKRFLKSLADDAAAPAPVRAAATDGRDLTIENYRLLN